MVQHLKTQYRILILIVVFTAIALALLFGWHYIRIIFAESLYMKKGTLEYFLTMDSEVIENFPLVNIVGEETYYSSCGDGNKPPANGVSFDSRADKAELVRRIEAYVTEHGYKKKEESSAGDEYRYARTRSELDVRLLNLEDPPILVVVTESYYNFDLVD